ncbi:MAG TPA: plasmid stabilization protein [Bdellovibrionales bacterium]|jgi:plasmid stabilization system protein ParE|nr:plasmid stabilization protein [Bdellovibrionales bacterium]HAS53920.1 plasmid stabilization protein [Nitrospiraceae bacterium]
MPILFLPEAEQEMIEAARYYHSQSAGLGTEYLSEVEHAVHSIATSPHTWPILQGDLRRRLIRRFPYGILYRIEPEEIIIVAISHLRKKPGYWKKRVEKG